jgi:hypothetical protein
LKINRLKILDNWVFFTNDKLIFGSKEYLPKGTHVTVHFGGDSGFADIHITNENSNVHIPLIRIKMDEIEAIGNLIVQKICNEFLSILKEKSISEIESEIDSFLNMEIEPKAEIEFNNYFDKKVKKRELKFSEDDFNDEEIFENRDNQAFGLKHFKKSSKLKSILPSLAVGFKENQVVSFLYKMNADKYLTINFIECELKMKNLSSIIFGEKLFRKIKDKFQEGIELIRSNDPSLKLVQLRIWISKASTPA